jgi:hypothetical protein
VLRYSDWQTPLSSVEDTRWSETVNGSLVLLGIGTTAARPRRIRKNSNPRSSEAGWEGLALLTKTDHRSRITVQGPRPGRLHSPYEINAFRQFVCEDKRQLPFARGELLTATDLLLCPEGFRNLTEGLLDPSEPNSPQNTLKYGLTGDPATKRYNHPGTKFRITGLARCDCSWSRTTRRFQLLFAKD